MLSQFFPVCIKAQILQSASRDNQDFQHHSGEYAVRSRYHLKRVEGSAHHLGSAATVNIIIFPICHLTMAEYKICLLGCLPGRSLTLMLLFISFFLPSFLFLVSFHWCFLDH